MRSGELVIAGPDSGTVEDGFGMDTKVLQRAPFFDQTELRQELAAIWSRHGSSDGRPLIIDRLKALHASALEAARTALESDGNGRRCAASISEFHDALIRLVFHHTVDNVYRATNPSDAERMAIVATGGYGRGLLAPGSDIDLLFLRPYKQTSWGESVAEHILYILWDLGLKVGHATRTVEQCLKHAWGDFTIRTALLDQRLICGDAELFNELGRRFQAEVVSGSGRAFVDAKMAERDQRHRRSGESRYLVEPNIKDGKGGLRDLHTLHWLAKYLVNQEPGKHGAESAVFTPAEISLYRRCERFLWSIRCHLHFLAGRAEERLTFDLQPIMAERLGYRHSSALRSVERFMKHYFLVAKDVGDLTTILCSALEIQQLKSTPRLNDFINPLTWVTRRRIRRTTDFRVDNERLNVASPDAFKRDPVNLLRFFAMAEELGTFFHPAAVRLLRSSWRLIDDNLRRDPEANRIFLGLLTSERNPEVALRRMNEAGVLGRFVPAFGRVVSMMQFNMYHHYTVDEHLIRTVGQLHAIEEGQLAATLPLSTEIVKSIQNRRALYVAAFLHDIGKGTFEDHSTVGVRIARELCPRLGLSAAETETVVWLIADHLTMSNIAQSRDLSDPKTIRDFAAVVQSPERLKLLLLLTVADIRAVGPGTWNGWKGQLLRQLYWETEPLVAGGHTQASRRDRVSVAKEDLRAALAGWADADVQRFIERQYDDYWLKTDTAKQIEHAKLVQRAERDGLRLATSYASNAFNAMTELSVLAANHPRLLSVLAGSCAAAGANIIGANVSTTRDGLALDTFLLQREFAEDEDEARRIHRISRTIERALNGEVRLATLMATKKPAERRIRAFSVEPEVIINNALSDAFTVVEVAGLDRPGFLYELTNAISDLNLDITSAHITTYGEKAVDVFYVTDLTGKKIESEARRANIRQRLVQVLAGEPSGRTQG
jgi:[protein-PII] uridylyltransferase